MKTLAGLCAVLLLLPGCVAPSDAKSASSEVTTALSELQSAERGFERELAALIDDTLEQIENTMVTARSTRSCRSWRKIPGAT